MARYEEFKIDKGSDVSIRLELTDTNGTIKDLTNRTLKGRIKKNYADSAGEATDFIGRIPEESQTQGVCFLELSNSTTHGLRAGRYVYDAEISHTDANGYLVKERILEGIITITPSVMDSA